MSHPACRATADDGVTKAIGSILGRTPSGLFVVTAADASGRETGMLASWVQQASFDPPMMTVALNRKRYLNAWLEESPRLAISFLGESHRDLLKHFAAGFAPDEPAFVGVDIARGATGLPLLARCAGLRRGEHRRPSGLRRPCRLRRGNLRGRARRVLAAGKADGPHS